MTSNVTSSPPLALMTRRDNSLQDKWLAALRADVKTMIGDVSWQWRNKAESEDQLYHHTKTERNVMLSGLMDNTLDNQTDEPPITNLQKPLRAMNVGVRESVTRALEGRQQDKCWIGHFEDTSKMDIETDYQSVKLTIKPSGAFYVRDRPKRSQYIETCHKSKVTGNTVKVVGAWVKPSVDQTSGLEVAGHWDWCRVLEADETAASAKTRAPGSQSSKGISRLTDGLRELLCIE
jgi:hypothetical protein